MTTPRKSENRPPAGRDGDGAKDPSALVRRSLDLLDGVSRLLQALSPAEIEATADRAQLGLTGDRAALHWRVYVDRHRVLSDVFATQRSTFAQLARAYLGRGSTSSEDPEEAR